MEGIIAIVVIVGLIVTLYNHAKNSKIIYEKIDGVESIDGITYLISNTNVDYVMYKLSSYCISKVIKKTYFAKTSENEGSLKFGGVVYDLNNRGSDKDRDIGASYKIKCIQKDSDVIMNVSYEGREHRWWYLQEKPDYLLNQAYHRFFKEQFDVKVI